ncbi:hypothetical protein C4X99_07895 [Leptospira interrogans serovar Geyaweera]|nr:hypothetical protein C5473_09885 [Leptospira interrogans serovar Weerasinghe]KAA1290318.1 hypothetical protein C4X99_07895 [Leptospira interrogans serovar Geyaweera]
MQDSHDVVLDIRIVEKLILYGFSLYGNGLLKRFVNCCYGIFQQLYYKSELRTCPKTSKNFTR